MEMNEILRKARTIAVVGLSDNPNRPSYDVASYLAEQGYKIIPVNPMITKWKGLPAYKSLSEVKESIDVVDIFRKSEDVPPIVEEAVKIHAKTVWMQLGIINEEAAEKARKAGLNVIMNKCMKIQHKLLDKM